jgi:hypothetical protein
MEKEPDYSKYTLDELFDAASHINREKYEERARRIDAEIAKRPRPAISNTPNKKKIMKEGQSLALLLLLFTVIAAIGGYLDKHHIPEPRWWQFTTLILCNLCIFNWYYNDSISHEFKRTKWLNIFMVGLSCFAVPYYLIRSRKKGHKLKSIIHCIKFILLLTLTICIAFIVGDVVGMFL